MKQVRDDNYYVVQAWMVTRLKLKGLEKDLFAIIYGYSQDEDSDFHGSLEYLSQLTGYTRNRICNALTRLTENNYIHKTVIKNGAVKRCHYVVNPEILETHNGPKDLDGRPKDLDGKDEKIAKSRPKDLDVYIIDNKNNKKNKKEEKEKPQLFKTNSKDMYQVFLDMFYEHCPSFGKITKLTEVRKRNIGKLFKNYDKQTILKVLDKCEQSQFLLDNSKKWAKLDWIIQDNNFIKILEGNYDSSYSKKPTVCEMPHNRGVRTRKATEEQKRETAKMLKELQERGERIEY